MDLPIPAGIDDIDDEWLSQALGLAVRAVEIDQIGQGVGVASALYRVTLDGDGPASAIIKLPALDEIAFLTSAVLQMYVREVGFYRELSAECPIRHPKPYHADIDIETSQFVILMEDLGACRVVDQIEGMSEPDAWRASRELARFQAYWWGQADPLVENGPAVSLGDPMYLDLLPPAFAEGWQKLTSAIAVSSPIEAAAAGWADALPRLLGSLSADPTTLVHGDYRADNMLFDEHDSVVLLDFQLIGKASAAYDLAYFVAFSLSAELASRVEASLFEDWRESLISAGVPESETTGLWDRYREAALFCLVYPAVASRGMDLSDERQFELLASMNERFGRAVDELNLLDLL